MFADVGISAPGAVLNCSVVLKSASVVKSDIDSGTIVVNFKSVMTSVGCSTTVVAMNFGDVVLFISGANVVKTDTVVLFISLGDTVVFIPAVVSRKLDVFVLNSDGNADAVLVVTLINSVSSAMGRQSFNKQTKKRWSSKKMLTFQIRCYSWCMLHKMA